MGMTYDEIESKIKSSAIKAYREQEKQLVSEYNALTQKQHPNSEPKGAFEDDNAMRAIERELLLKIADSHWTEHRQETDELRSNIGMLAMAEKDPVRAFQISSSEMFNEMMDDIQKEAVQALFRVEIIP